jgi:GTP cyclohydrolase I
MVTKEFIIAHMEKMAPSSLCESWDNIGMIIDICENVTGVMVVVDVTADIIFEAVSKNVNLIISHHPIIFDALKSIDKQDVVYLAIKNDISVYCAHTNMDLAENGVNQALAVKLGLKDIDLLSDDREVDFGRIGKLSTPMSLKDFALFVKQKLDAPSLRVLGAKDRMVLKVAVSSGSGAEKIADAEKMGADVIVTGEVKHNHYIDNLAKNMGIIDAGHYDTEKHFVNMVRKSLQSAINDVDYSLAVFLSDNEIRPYWTI